MSSTKRKPVNYDFFLTEIGSGNSSQLSVNEKENAMAPRHERSASSIPFKFAQLKQALDFSPKKIKAAIKKNPLRSRSWTSYDATLAVCDLSDRTLAANQSLSTWAQGPQKKSPIIQWQDRIPAAPIQSLESVLEHILEEPPFAAEMADLETLPDSYKLHADRLKDLSLQLSVLTSDQLSQIRNLTQEIRECLVHLEESIEGFQQLH